MKLQINKQCSERNNVKIIIEINETEKKLKEAIAIGWNRRFDDKLIFRDIQEVSNKEDILSAIPELDSDKIKITVTK